VLSTRDIPKFCLSAVKRIFLARAAVWTITVQCLMGYRIVILWRHLHHISKEGSEFHFRLAWFWTCGERDLQILKIIVFKLDSRSRLVKHSRSGSKLFLSAILCLGWSIVHTIARSVGIRRRKLSSSHHRVHLTVLRWSRATSTCSFEPRRWWFVSYVLILRGHNCITLHLLWSQSVLSILWIR